MNHFYQTIPGYFSFPDFYSWLAREFPEGRGVEVGSFAGRSAAYLAVELETARNALVASTGEWESSSPARIDLVDTFAVGHSPESVRASLSPAAYLIGDIVQAESHVAASRYADGSLDWVYIDADHSFAAVRRDIRAWLPKVRKGGVIAGHDFAPYPTFGVIEAVTQAFPRFEVWRGELFVGDGIRDFTHDGAWLNRHYPSWCARV